MHNPFSGWGVSGDWADHMSYSLGGTDYPLNYATPLPAPGSGTLYTRGRPGPGDEFQCGQVGSAGRRQILMLDEPIGPMVAIVFQHLAAFGVHERHYDERESTGLSGASANGKDWGGTSHLHIHGLTAAGKRVDFTRYATTASTASATPKPVTPKPRRKTMTGAFYRIASGEGQGVIYWQEKPNTVLVLLDYVTWSAYAAQGNLYKDVTAAEIQGLIQKHGQSAKPA